MSFVAYVRILLSPMRGICLAHKYSHSAPFGKRDEPHAKSEGERSCNRPCVYVVINDLTIQLFSSQEPLAVLRKSCPLSSAPAASVHLE